MSFAQYLFKYVNVVDIWGNEFKRWYVMTFTDRTDNLDIYDRDEDSIGIKPGKDVKYGVILYASEIAHIEICD